LWIDRKYGFVFSSTKRVTSDLKIVELCMIESTGCDKNVIFIAVLKTGHVHQQIVENGSLGNCCSHEIWFSHQGRAHQL
jgi:hypothetical protein